ncbi:ATP-binding protein [Sediminibacterium ginsengisoli]|uniref:Anti-sigma regulatory factor (Ser/Thr protein kinase) n=1 Tax=Sediminibacterium ginsengisoli TaxID=413434 RepID=A0A1T4P8N6_9BACT|nr:ATP-binding protein [Sediminibacterium ginsengisoli]SJZ87687.1 Anti-sigma regulatory factor (Ser/Thr protein kinase) [Sediminibacterium ginsengisoli]
MVSRIHTQYRASDRSYLALLKKEIHALATSAGFSAAKTGRIDIVVAEMVSNLVKHAQDGHILVRLVEFAGMQGIELITIDRGPGMSDVSRMMTDGMSTKNTLGHGFGAMKRMADVFQVYSQRGWGTIVLTRLFEADFPSLKKLPDTEIQNMVLPKPGETACGDGAFTLESAQFLKVFLGDGLGHGPEAELAVLAAGKAFRETRENDPVSIIREMNTAVKKTRGLVGAVAVLNKKERKWRICGVGNISVKILGESFNKTYTSYNGIIGLNLPNTLNAQEALAERGQQLILCSDGLKSRWELVKHPGIGRFDPVITAAALMMDYSRNTDDLSVLICKLNR